jgi:nucleoside-diphosphate-sugar epimerase
VGARVLLTSSAAVYGNQTGILSEAGPVAPASPYGQAKHDMEQQAAVLGAELGVSVCVLRIGNIAGVDAILGGWRPGCRLDRFADGRSPARSYIGAQTLARVLADLVATPDLPDVLNIAEPGPVEMSALLDAADLAWIPQDAPDTAIPQVELDVRRLQTLCPWLPGAADPARMVAQWRRLAPRLS